MSTPLTRLYNSSSSSLDDSSGRIVKKSGSHRLPLSKKQTPFPKENVDSAFRNFLNGKYKIIEFHKAIVDATKRVKRIDKQDNFLMYGRLEIIEIVDQLKLKPSEFIPELVKRYLMNHSTNKEKACWALAVFRGKVPEKYQELYDVTIYNLLSFLDSKTYFKVCQLEPRKDWFEHPKLDPIEKSVLQILHVSKVIWSHRERMRDRQEMVHYSTSVAQIGNVAIVAPYVQSLYLLLNEQKSSMDEMEASLRKFIETISYTKLGNTNTIYKKLQQIKASLMEVEGNTESPEKRIASSVEKLFCREILRYCYPSLITKHAWEIVRSVKEGTHEMVYLISHYRRFQKHQPSAVELLNAAVLNQLDAEKTLLYIEQLMKDLPEGSDKKWLRNLLFLAQQNLKEKYLALITSSVENANPGVLPSGETLFREDTPASLLLKEALALELEEYGANLFSCMINHFPKDEAEAARLDLKNQERNVESEDSHRQERAKRRFARISRSILNEILEFKLPKGSLEILNLMRETINRHFQIAPEMVRQTLANVLIHRGLGTLLTKFIEDPETQPPLNDATKRLFYQFQVQVLQKLTIPNAHSGLSGMDPLRRIHDDFHEQVMSLID